MRTDPFTDTWLFLIGQQSDEVALGWGRWLVAAGLALLVLASIVIAMPVRAASSGLCAVFAPCCAKARALAALRFQTVTSCPAPISWLAMPEPIWPSPRNATSIIASFILLSRRRPDWTVRRRLSAILGQRGWCPRRSESQPAPDLRWPFRTAAVPRRCWTLHYRTKAASSSADPVGKVALRWSRNAETRELKRRREG